MLISDAVSRDPEIMSGALCFRGTRIPVSMLFDCLQDGGDIDGFLSTYDWVTRDAVESVLEFSKHSVGHFQEAS